MGSEMTTAEMVEYMRNESESVASIAVMILEFGATPEQHANATDRVQRYRAIADRLEALESLYAKAWAECLEWRLRTGDPPLGELGWTAGNPEPETGGYWKIPTADAHDAARKEAGL